jgi:four helix bundle protein
MNQYTIELQNRTKQLAISTIQMVRSIKIDLINRNTIYQVLRSSSSVGANYNEALECESKDDFVHKLSICKKEANETRYWLSLLVTTNTTIKTQAELLNQEAMELVKIFAATIATTKRNQQLK